MSNVDLKCQCGQIKGIARNISPQQGTRVVCYCKDCQAFASHLNTDTSIVNQYGGTDIYQLPPANIEISQGREQLKCLRLSPKGLYRWYAGCCNTPIANVVSHKIPLVGVIHNFIADPDLADQSLGPVKAHVNIQGASKRLPKEWVDKAAVYGYLAKVAAKLLIWKISGKGNPSPFFDQAGKPVSTPIIHPGP